MLSNAYLLAKFRFDTAENERNFAEFLPKTDNYAPRITPCSDLAPLILAALPRAGVRIPTLAGGALLQDLARLCFF